MVVLSGRPCPLYDEELYSDWERHEFPHLDDGARTRTEVLWLNPACAEALRRQPEQGSFMDAAR
jgi:DNA adenine methylase